MKRDTNPILTTMDFNAIVREKNAEIIGKILLKDLKSIPSEWDVTYNRKRLSTDVNLKTLLCDSKFPLSINAYPVVERLVTVKDVTGMSTQLRADKYTTIDNLKMMIQSKRGIPADQQRLIYAGLQLEDGRTIGEYVRDRECTFHLRLRLRGGGCVGSVGPSFSSVDLETKHVTGQGVPATNDWEGYSCGLNSEGTCPNIFCKSNLKKSATYSRMGYGDLVLDLEKNRFGCAACGAKFVPTNFIVSSARSLFRFRKAGCFEIQSTLLESFGGIDNYSMFDPKGKNADYDVIEIRTVRESESHLTCLQCDKRISSRNDALLYDCLHSVHKKCMDEQGCKICKAKLMTVDEFEAIIKKNKGKWD
ncbi:Ubiquitin [Orchesella cincta]|uniref:Ubiquitin n=1 Tax=Orchesella cincta TaxID=48709 RepID=A0A1D2ME24_ORCCI|nr:Ubiquitin [Orchesella cincta]